MSQRNQPPAAVPGWAPPPAAKPKKPIWQRWWFIALVAIVVLGGLGRAFGGGGEIAAPAASPSATAAPESETATPKEQLEADIRAELGESNRDGVQRVGEIRVGKNMFVRWAATDNLSAGLIATGMRNDAVDVLRAIAESGEAYKTIELRITMAMVDRKGNSSEDVVVQADYSKAELDDVNWDNFLARNVWAIADRAVVHPEFR